MNGRKTLFSLKLYRFLLNYSRLDVFMSTTMHCMIKVVLCERIRHFLSFTIGNVISKTLIWKTVSLPKTEETSSVITFKPSFNFNKK